MQLPPGQSTWTLRFDDFPKMPVNAARYISMLPLCEYSYAEGAGKLACNVPNGTKWDRKTSNCCTNRSRPIRRTLASAASEAAILLTVRVNTTHLKD